MVIKYFKMRVNYMKSTVCGEQKPANIKAIDPYMSLVHYYILSEWYTDDDTQQKTVKL